MKTSPRKIRLHLFFRRPLPGDHFSIERLFDAVMASLPADRFEMHRLVCPFESRGLLRRLASMTWAAFHQGDINHITGDVNFLGLLMRRSRTMLTILDSASMIRLSGWRRWLYYFIWLRLPIWRAGRVTVISQRTLEETLSYVKVDRPKLVVIPCCLTLGIETTPKIFSEAKPRFLVIGTKQNKNLPHIMAALQGIPCQLVIVGSLSKSHRQLIAAYGLDIENHVGLDDSAIADQYQAADAVLFIPTYEGFGLPILEAQAAGRPLITSRRSPMHEVAGPGACLVDPESIDEIRTAVLRVVHDPAYRETLVQSGSENVRLYSPEVIASHYAAAYEEMLFSKKNENHTSNA